MQRNSLQIKILVGAIIGPALVLSCKPLFSEKAGDSDVVQVAPSVEGFEPYVEQFREAAKAVGATVDIPAMRVELKPGADVVAKTKVDKAVAVCLRSVDSEGKDVNTPQIWVSQEWWDKVEHQFSGDDIEAARQSVIFHEMGHCVLKRTHSETTILEGRQPASLMYYSYIKPVIYIKARNYYWAELFGMVKEGEAPSPEMKKAYEESRMRMGSNDGPRPEDAYRSEGAREGEAGYNPGSQAVTEDTPAEQPMAEQPANPTTEPEREPAGQ